MAAAARGVEAGDQENASGVPAAIAVLNGVEHDCKSSTLAFADAQAAGGSLRIGVDRPRPVQAPARKRGRHSDDDDDDRGGQAEGRICRSPTRRR